MAAHFWFLSWLSWITIIWCRWLSRAIITHCQEQKELAWVARQALGTGPCHVAATCLFQFISNFTVWAPASPNLAFTVPLCFGGGVGEKQNMGNGPGIPLGWAGAAWEWGWGGGRNEQWVNNSSSSVPTVRAENNVNTWERGGILVPPPADGAFKPHTGRAEGC